MTGRSQCSCLRLFPLKFSLLLENCRGILLFIYTICEGWRVALLLIFQTTLGLDQVQNTGKGIRTGNRLI